MSTRKVFYIDVANMSRKEAHQYVAKVVKAIKNKRLS